MVARIFTYSVSVNKPQVVGAIGFKWLSKIAFCCPFQFFQNAGVWLCVYMVWYNYLNKLVFVIMDLLYNILYGGKHEAFFRAERYKLGYCE